MRDPWVSLWAALDAPGGFILSTTDAAPSLAGDEALFPRAPTRRLPPELRWRRIGGLPLQIRMRAPVWGNREYRSERGARIAAACVATLRGTDVAVVVPTSTEGPEREVCVTAPMRWSGAAFASRVVLAAMRVEALASAARRWRMR